MDIFWMLDPDPHNNRCGSATLKKTGAGQKWTGSATLHASHLKGSHMRVLLLHIQYAHSPKYRYGMHSNRVADPKLFDSSSIVSLSPRLRQYNVTFINK